MVGGGLALSLHSQQTRCRPTGSSVPPQGQDLPAAEPQVSPPPSQAEPFQNRFRTGRRTEAKLLYRQWDEVSPAPAQRRGQAEGLG